MSPMGFENRMKEKKNPSLQQTEEYSKIGFHSSLMSDKRGLEKGDSSKEMVAQRKR